KEDKRPAGRSDGFHETGIEAIFANAALVLVLFSLGLFRGEHRLGSFANRVCIASRDWGLRKIYFRNARKDVLVIAPLLGFVGASRSLVVLVLGSEPAIAESFPAGLVPLRWPIALPPPVYSFFRSLPALSVALPLVAFGAALAPRFACGSIHRLSEGRNESAPEPL